MPVALHESSLEMMNHKSHSPSEPHSETNKIPTCTACPTSSILPHRDRDRDKDRDRDMGVAMAWGGSLTRGKSQQYQEMPEGMVGEGSEVSARSSLPSVSLSA